MTIQETVKEAVYEPRNLLINPFYGNDQEVTIEVSFCMDPASWEEFKKTESCKELDEYVGSSKIWMPKKTNRGTIGQKEFDWQGYATNQFVFDHYLNNQEICRQGKIRANIAICCSVISMVISVAVIIMSLL